MLLFFEKQIEGIHLKTVCLPLFTPSTTIVDMALCKTNSRPICLHSSEYVQLLDS